MVLDWLRDWLRQWLLTPDQRVSVHPNRVSLVDGSIVVATGVTGVCLLAQELQRDDGSGGRRVITVQQAADPVQFWAVWHRVSGQSAVWASDGVDARPSAF